MMAVPPRCLREREDVARRCEKNLAGRRATGTFFAYKCW